MTEITCVAAVAVGVITRPQVPATSRSASHAPARAAREVATLRAELREERARSWALAARPDDRQDTFRAELEIGGRPTVPVALVASGATSAATP